jgi:AcrR family transcriptional regulator
VTLTSSARTERRRAVVRDEVLATAWSLAREGGVATVSLKNVAARMGIKPPSLYEYVPNLHGLFDLMFRSGWQQLLDEVTTVRSEATDLSESFRRILDFCVADPPRFELMLQRPIPGFVPSSGAFAVAQEAYESMRGGLADFGITRQADMDLIDSMLLGLAGNQIANDPGGSRFVDLADEAIGILSRRAKRRNRQ